jgi:hypothetical protein
VAQSRLHGLGLPGCALGGGPSAQGNHGPNTIAKAYPERLRHAQGGWTDVSLPRVQAAKQIIVRFCGGSLEELLVGLVDNDMVSRKELQQLARRIGSKKPGGK